MFGNKTLDRLDQMLDEALSGTFQEEIYNETKLSRLETKWKRFLAASLLSKENLTREKEKVKSLVSDISHQTKTPMTNIKLYVDLLKETLQSDQDMEKKEESMRLLEEISRQTSKLEFLIQALTKMSRLESNIVEVKPVGQPVGGLLEETITDFLEKARQKKVVVRNIYDGEGKASFDYKWTKEALGNVLDNAIKYSEPESVITISVTEYEMYLAISVKDQGIGIRQENVSKIFGRFYREEAVNQEDGVGIGLYLTREILKKEDGYIKVKSIFGKGSEFILYLHKE